MHLESVVAWIVCGQHWGDNPQSVNHTSYVILCELIRYIEYGWTDCHFPRTETAPPLDKITKYKVTPIPATLKNSAYICQNIHKHRQKTNRHAQPAHSHMGRQPLHPDRHPASDMECQERRSGKDSKQYCPAWCKSTALKKTQDLRNS